MRERVLPPEELPLEQPLRSSSLLLLGPLLLQLQLGQQEHDRLVAHVVTQGVLLLLLAAPHVAELLVPVPGLQLQPLA